MVNQQRLDDVFAALSDPIRRHIVERLACGPLTVGEIAAGFAISQPAISRHVRRLEESGLLLREIEGRIHRCALAPAAIDAATGWLERQRTFWNAALDRLDGVLEQASGKPHPQRKRKRS